MLGILTIDLCSDYDDGLANHGRDCGIQFDLSITYLLVRGSFDIGCNGEKVLSTLVCF